MLSFIHFFSCSVFSGANSNKFENLISVIYIRVGNYDYYLSQKHEEKEKADKLIAQAKKEAMRISKLKEKRKKKNKKPKVI